MYGTRSSRSQMFFKIGVFKNFVLFTGKLFCWSLSFITFTQKRLQHRCFFCKHCEIFKNNLFYRTLPVAAFVVMTLPQNSCTEGSIYKTYSEKFLKTQRKTSVSESETLVSCEFCEIFKSIFFTEHLQTTASVF